MRIFKRSASGSRLFIQAGIQVMVWIGEKIRPDIDEKRY
jgi:hypothetical protein